MAPPFEMAGRGLCERRWLDIWSMLSLTLCVRVCVCAFPAIRMWAVHLWQRWHCPLSSCRLCPSTMCQPRLPAREMLPWMSGRWVENSKRKVESKTYKTGGLSSQPPCILSTLLLVFHLVVSVQLQSLLPLCFIPLQVLTATSMRHAARWSPQESPSGSTPAPSAAVTTARMPATGRGTVSPPAPASRTVHLSNCPLGKTDPLCLQRTSC